MSEAYRSADPPSKGSEGLLPPPHDGGGFAFQLQARPLALALMTPALTLLTVADGNAGSKALVTRVNLFLQSAESFRSAGCPPSPHRLLQIWCASSLIAGSEWPRHLSTPTRRGS
jgi:hypothetical protein